MGTNKLEQIEKAVLSASSTPFEQADTFFQQVQQLQSENDRMRQELSVLQDKLFQKDQTITYLKGVLAQYATPSDLPFIPPDIPCLKKKREISGKKKSIDASTRERVILLYQQKYSMRKIAEAESISLGSTHSIIHEFQSKQKGEIT